MKVAIVGSRSIEYFDLSQFLPEQTTEIVSGGAAGVDTIAKNYAVTHNIKYTEFLPEYQKYGRNAPLLRNVSIIEYADEVLVFWDGKSKGSKFVIEHCHKTGVPVRIFVLENNIDTQG